MLKLLLKITILATEYFKYTKKIPQFHVEVHHEIVKQKDQLHLNYCQPYLNNEYKINIDAGAPIEPMKIDSQLDLAFLYSNGSKKYNKTQYNNYIMNKSETIK